VVSAIPAIRRQPGRIGEDSPHAELLATLLTTKLGTQNANRWPCCTTK